jgi:hypothetical protein
VTSSVATATPQRWDFPKVTKTITVRNTDSTAANGIYIGWTENGVSGSNRFLIPGGESETFDIRCKSLWVLLQAGTPAYSIFAGVTVIDAERDFPILTGSAGSGPGDNWQGIG